MSRYTRTQAWDHAWQDMEHIAGLGRLDPSPAQQALRQSLQTLYGLPLPREAIETLGHVVCQAWQVGRESAEPPVAATNAADEIPERFGSGRS